MESGVLGLFFFWVSLGVLSLIEVLTRVISRGRVPHHYTVAGITGVCSADESHTITPSWAALSVIQRMRLLGFLVNNLMGVLLLRRQGSKPKRTHVFFYLFSIILCSRMSGNVILRLVILGRTALHPDRIHAFLVAH